mgnify:CR=1 FL=1
MNIKYPIKHLIWRFKNSLYDNNNKPRPKKLAIYPTEKDLNSLNSLNEYYNQIEKEGINNFQLFAKLFCECYKRTLKLNDKNSVRWISEALKIPVAQHIEMLTNELNYMEFIKLKDSLGISKDHPAIINDNQREIDLKLISDNNTHLIKSLNKWEYENVEKNIVNIINNIIQEHA